MDIQSQLDKFRHPPSGTPQSGRCLNHPESKVHGAHYFCLACLTEEARLLALKRQEEHLAAKAQGIPSLLDRLGIPPRVFDPKKSFAAGHPAHDLTRTWRMVNDREGAVLLSGPMGIGKSAWACSQLYESEKGIFISLLRMVRNIRATWKDGAERTEAREMEIYMGPGILVLDDVGVQAGSENERNLVYEILMHRYNHSLETILTTNLNPVSKEGKEELERCLGQRIVDRIIGGLVSCGNWQRVRGAE